MIYPDRFFFRYIGSLLYDGMLLFSVLFIATFLLLPLIGTGAIESGNPIYTLFLLIISYFYFCWQWVTGGQTLGMKSWKLIVVNEQQQKLNWKRASIRFLASLISCALFGLGFLIGLFNKQHKTLHDLLSKTQLVDSH